MHVKCHIPASSFARDSLHPFFSNSNFSFFFYPPPRPLGTTQQLFIAYFSLSCLSRQDTIAKWRKDERSTALCKGLMKKTGWEPPVQHLAKSGESSGGIHSPTVARGNRLELKVQKKRPHGCAQTAEGGGGCAQSAAASVLLENVSGSRRGSDRPHARYRWMARWRPSSGRYERVERNLPCASDRGSQGSEDENYQCDGTAECLKSQNTRHWFIIYERSMNK